MGDSLRKVKSGDPLAIPAATFNAFIDAADDFQRRRHNQGQQALPAALGNTSMVLIKNDSPGHRERFDVLGIDGPLFTPTDNLDTFKNGPPLIGVTPLATTHAGRFVILLEPIRQGQVGRAVLAGVIVARVNVSDEAHNFAEVNDGVHGSLASGPGGSAQILWREPGTGVKWAVVRLGSSSLPTASGSGVLARVIGSLGSATYTVIEQSTSTGSGYENKSGASGFTAVNVAELDLGPGDAVDVDTLVLVSTVNGAGGTRYVFSHSPYAKYLD